MPESVVVEIKGVGPVLLERSRRARHISITVKPFRGVRVAVPADVSFKKALEFPLFPGKVASGKNKIHYSPSFLTSSP